MKWQEALKIWNEHHKTINPAHVWAMPRKGTSEHAQVKAIQSGVMPDHATFKDTVKSILAGAKKAAVAKQIKDENKRAKAKVASPTHPLFAKKAVAAPAANAEPSGAYTLPKLSTKAIAVKPEDYAKYIRTYVSGEDAAQIVEALQANYPEGAKLWKPAKAIRAKELDD